MRATLMLTDELNDRLAKAGLGGIKVRMDEEEGPGHYYVAPASAKTWRSSLRAADFIAHSLSAAEVNAFVCGLLVMRRIYVANAEAKR